MTGPHGEDASPAPCFVGRRSAALDPPRTARSRPTPTRPPGSTVDERAPPRCVLSTGASYRPEHPLGHITKGRIAPDSVGPSAHASTPKVPVKGSFRPCLGPVLAPFWPPIGPRIGPHVAAQPMCPSCPPRGPVHSPLMLRTVAATRYVTPFREGGSLPGLVRGGRRRPLRRQVPRRRAGRQGAGCRGDRGRAGTRARPPGPGAGPRGARRPARAPASRTGR